MRRCLSFQQLGISQQQRGASGTIHAPNQPSSPRSTNTGGCSFPAMLAELCLAPPLSLNPKDWELRSREEEAKPACGGLMISIAIVSSLWGPRAHRVSKAQARGLVLIQPHAAPAARAGHAAGLGHLGPADGWMERKDLCACVCVSET